MAHRHCSVCSRNYRVYNHYCQHLAEEIFSPNMLAGMVVGNNYRMHSVILVSSQPEDHSFK
jgi:hypothetical protein